MVKHILKTLRLSHRKILKVCLAILQHALKGLSRKRLDVVCSFCIFVPFSLFLIFKRILPIRLIHLQPGLVYGERSKS